MPDMVELEMKLVPADPALLDRLAARDQIGSFAVVDRRREEQRNAFFDTPDGALGAARLAFRRRDVDDEDQATWTLKGPGSIEDGLSRRPEVEALLPSATPPALALGRVLDLARTRGALELARLADRALCDANPLRSSPFLEFATDRTVLILADAARGWTLELALDRMRMPRWPEVLDLEIEVELKQGAEVALEELRAAIEALGTVRPARQTKLARARALDRAYQAAVRLAEDPPWGH